MSNEPFTDADIISVYTIEQATEDGVLLNIRTVNPAWEKGMFSHVTVNLLVSCGYLKDDSTLNIPNLLDLLNQSLQIVKRKSENFTKWDRFFEGEIELPSGNRQQVFIQLNELEKFTIMLPEDY